jgi:broad specificity phosphatase PhoE
MGRRDLPLDAVGRVQAVGLTAALEGAIPVRTRVRIHSSPLVRAVDTIAGYAAARLLPVHRDPLLMEMDFEIRYQAWDRRATDPVAVWSPGTWAHNEVVAD